MYSLVITAI